MRNYEVVDEFENGEIGLSVVQFSDPVENRFWIKAGSAGLELTEHGMDDLVELLSAYELEYGLGDTRFWPAGKSVGFITLAFFAALILGMVIGSFL